MNINMIGIDHIAAPVHIREKVALTSSKLVRALKIIKGYYKVSGVVIISTCNRTEIWLSNYRDEITISEMASRIFNVPLQFIEENFILRNSIEAVKHIFSLSSGMESRIIGEDQILTQVRESADIARKYKAIDSVLEKLFRMGVTCGKKVKSTLKIKRFNNSIGKNINWIIMDKFKAPITCLVIGNGEIGRGVAEELLLAGHSVYMTTRSYKHGQGKIVEGATPVNYENRYDYINQNVVISGTLSPHYTLTRSKVIESLDGNERIFIDLAMPRDIEESISEIAGVTLYDIDSISNGDRNIYSNIIREAEAISREYIDEFSDYYYTRGSRKNYYKAKLEGIL
ncbi:MAG: glutamyl-tRNA reductase [Clostridium sp.]|uniref:glutamyl-tRNA reductase n=1 Tax=Clostridium sp. TaxID=1506 RepID=UPI002FCA6874